MNYARLVPPSSNSRCTHHLKTCIHSYILYCDLVLSHMTLTFKLDLNGVKVNQRIKYLLKCFQFKSYCPDTDMQRDTHTIPVHLLCG